MYVLHTLAYCSVTSLDVLCIIPSGITNTQLIWMNVSAYSSNYLVPQCSPCSLVLERGSRNSMLNLSS